MMTDAENVTSGVLYGFYLTNAKEAINPDLLKEYGMLAAPTYIFNGSWGHTIYGIRATITRKVGRCETLIGADVDQLHAFRECMMAEGLHVSEMGFYTVIYSIEEPITLSI